MKKFILIAAILLTRFSAHAEATKEDVYFGQTFLALMSNYIEQNEINDIRSQFVTAYRFGYLHQSVVNVTLVSRLIAARENNVELVNKLSDLLLVFAPENLKRRMSSVQFEERNLHKTGAQDPSVTGHDIEHDQHVMKEMTEKSTEHIARETVRGAFDGVTNGAPLDARDIVKDAVWGAAKGAFKGTADVIKGDYPK